MSEWTVGRLVGPCAAGNGTEKARMGRVSAAGETVVDLFAGIGYYTLQLLRHAGVAKVYACEWNPNSVAALRANLVSNGGVVQMQMRVELIG